MALPHDKHQLLFMEDLENIGVAPMKDALIQDMKKSLVEVFELSSHSAHKGIKKSILLLLVDDSCRYDPLKNPGLHID